MTIDQSVMAEATRLTRAGRVQEATALLQGGRVEASADGPRSDLRARLGQLRDLGSNLTSRLGSAKTTSDERPYRLHVPESVAGSAESVPLVVMLHGGTQDGATFEAATRMDALADEHGFIVAYPEQVTSANPMRYWNWFDPADQQRGSGEPAILAGIVQRISAEYPVDPARVYVAGFSAGAAMAAVLGATYPDVFAAIGVHSGLAYGSAQNVGAAMGAMRSAPPTSTPAKPVPVIVFHGDADSTVDISNARAVLDQFCPKDAPRQGVTARSFTKTTVGDGHGELWTLHGVGHAWSGGLPGGSYTDPSGPDASAELVRFFGEHRLG